MRRLLIVTYHYPPRPSVGSIRPKGLVKYLPDFGWECVVLTPRLEGTRRANENVIETDYIDVIGEWKERLHLNREQSLHEQFHLPLASKPNRTLPFTSLIESLRSVLAFPDPTKGWIRFASDEIHQLLGRHFDAVISSAPPFTSHLVARRAQRLLQLPWIADFRDLWAENVEKSLLQPFERLLERKTLASADALVTVSEVWAQRLRAAYRDKQICTIANGFDPDDYARNGHRLTDQFSITYTGQLYRGRRDPTPFLETIRELIVEGVLARDNLQVRFYGAVEPWLTTSINALGLSDITEIAGTISRHEAIERQRESQILLQLGWYDPREKGQHTGKLFEYLAARRPILAVGGAPGVMTDILAETGAGVHVQSKIEMRHYLTAAYRHFKIMGCVPYDGNERAINQYTHAEMARKFADLLNSVMERSSEARVS